MDAGAVAAQTALLRQSIALETLKIANEQSQSLLAMITQASEMVAASSSQGVNLDISV